MNQHKDLLQNRYRLRTVLGTGGFSTIYLAVDEVTGQEVSIKEFTAEHMQPPCGSTRTTLPASPIPSLFLTLPRFPRKKSSPAA